jgi:hypothetical protein
VGGGGGGGGRDFFFFFWREIPLPLSPSFLPFTSIGDVRFFGLQDQGI